MEGSNEGARKTTRRQQGWKEKEDKKTIMEKEEECRLRRRKGTKGTAKEGHNKRVSRNGSARRIRSGKVKGKRGDFEGVEVLKLEGKKEGTTCFEGDRDGGRRG